MESGKSMKNVVKSLNVSAGEFCSQWPLSLQYYEKLNTPDGDGDGDDILG